MPFLSREVSSLSSSDHGICDLIDASAHSPKYVEKKTSRTYKRALETERAHPTSPHSQPEYSKEHQPCFSHKQEERLHGQKRHSMPSGSRTSSQDNDISERCKERMDPTTVSSRWVTSEMVAVGRWEARGSRESLRRPDHEASNIALAELSRRHNTRWNLHEDSSDEDSTESEESDINNPPSMNNVFTETKSPAKDRLGPPPRRRNSVVQYFESFVISSEALTANRAKC